jgi:hypothetical protein
LAELAGSVRRKEGSARELDPANQAAVTPADLTEVVEVARSLAKD